MSTPKVQILGLGYSKEESDEKYALATDLAAVQEEINGVEEDLLEINEGGVD